MQNRIRHLLNDWRPELPEQPAQPAPQEPATPPDSRLTFTCSGPPFPESVTFCQSASGKVYDCDASASGGQATPVVASTAATRKPPPYSPVTRLGVVMAGRG